MTSASTQRSRRAVSASGSATGSCPAAWAACPRTVASCANRVGRPGPAGPSETSNERCTRRASSSWVSPTGSAASAAASAGVERPGKPTSPVQRGLVRRQHAVALLDGEPDRAVVVGLAVLGAATADARQSAGVVADLLGDLLERERPGACGRELHRERDAVEVAADPDGRLQSRRDRRGGGAGAGLPRAARGTAGRPGSCARGLGIRQGQGGGLQSTSPAMSRGSRLVARTRASSGQASSRGSTSSRRRRPGRARSCRAAAASVARG